MRPTAAELAAALGLEPHPEGGYFVETFRAAPTTPTARGERPAATAIMFLVTEDSPSRLHRLASDELWVYQAGVPLELVTIAPDGGLLRRVLADPGEAGGAPSGGAAGGDAAAGDAGVPPRRRWRRPAVGRAPASRADPTCRPTGPGRW